MFNYPKILMSVILCIANLGLVPGLIIAAETDTIIVGGYEFDPLDLKLSIPKDMTVSYKDTDTGYFLVQFRHLPSDGDLDWLNSRIEERIWHQSGSTYLVRAVLSEMNKAKEDKRVRWIGELHPYFRLSKKINKEIIHGYKENNFVPVRVRLVRADEEAAHKTIVELGGIPFGRRSEQTLRPTVSRFYKFPEDILESLAKVEGVIWVGPYYPAKLMDERSDQILAGNYNASYQPSDDTYETWLSNNSVDGTGVTVEMVDSGLCTGNNSTLHQDLRGRIDFHNDTTGDGNHDVVGHGTNCAGIVAGNATLNISDGSGYKYGLGVAPGTHIGNTRIFDDNGEFSFPDLTSTTQNAYQNGARLSSQSWGSSYSSCLNYPMTYDDRTEDYDTFVRDADPSTSGNQEYCIFNSAGNAGTCYSNSSSPSNLGNPAIAKNIITVGASENYRMDGEDGCLVDDSGADNGNDKIDFSSVGPFDGNQIKPDVMAPGTHIQSLASQYSGYDGLGVCNQYWPTGQTNYNWCSGTSQACPHAAGAGAIFYEWYSDTYSSSPSPALIKGALINGADDMVGGDTGHSSPSTMPNIPNRFQGWGRINMSNTINNGQDMIYIDQTTILGSNGSTHEYYLQVSDPGEPFKVTLVWTDAPGTPDGDVFKNNLDLTVIGSSTYLGNNFSNGWSVTGGSSDTENNVECVYIQNPSGVYTIRIASTSLTDDGVPGNGDSTDQDYAIVIYNAVYANETPTPTATPSAPTHTPTETITPTPTPCIWAGFDVYETPNDDNRYDDTTYFYDEGNGAGSVNADGTLTGWAVRATTAGEVALRIIRPEGGSQYSYVGGTSVVSISSGVNNFEDSISIDVQAGDIAALYYTSGDTAEIGLNGTGDYLYYCDGDVASLTGTFPADGNSSRNGYQLVRIYGDCASEPTNTPTVFGTSTPTPSSTETPLPTETPTNTEIPTFTPIPTITPTPGDCYVLLVDDDDNAPDVRSYFTNALTTLGYTYDVFDVGGGTGNGPDSSTMDGYDVVIWFSGDQWNNNSDEAGPNSTDEIELTTYLENGGRFFLSSQDYLYDMNLTSFGQTYLGILEYIEEAGSTEVTGQTGDPVGDGFTTLTLNHPFTDYSDSLTPGVMASTAFVNENSVACNIDVDGGTWKTVFFASSWTAIYNQSSMNGEDVMQAVLLFLCPGEVTATPTNTPIPTDTPTPQPTDTMTPVPSNTPTQIHTFTPEPTITPTPIPSDTPTPVPTDTPTPIPTDTPTPVPTETATPYPSDTPTPIPTNTPTPIPTDTPTTVPTNTPTSPPLIPSTGPLGISFLLVLLGGILLLSKKRNQ